MQRLVTLAMIVFVRVLHHGAGACLYDDENIDDKLSLMLAGAADVTKYGAE